MQDDLPTRFQNVRDFARLPWFDVQDGRLVLADPDVPPSIDMHAHLALSYVLPPRVDLHRATPRTQHYLDADGPIDLVPYANENFQPQGLTAMKKDLTLGSLAAGGMRGTHTIPNLKREMADMRVRHAVLLPIDFPALSRNAKTWMDAVRGDPAFVPFGSVHPHARDPEKKLRRQQGEGARGVKIHPAVQMVAPDHPRSRALCRHCERLGLPVLFHCGPVGIEPKAGRLRSQVYRYEKTIAECTDLTFVLGHSGALQMETALGFARKYPNVWLELSSQGLPAVRTILEKAPSDRIVFGSDWPFYHLALPLAKVLIASDGDRSLRRQVLWANAARLLDLEIAVVN